MSYNGEQCRYIDGLDIRAAQRDPIGRTPIRNVIAAFVDANADLGENWIEYDLLEAGFEVNDYDRAFIRRRACQPSPRSSYGPHPNSLQPAEAL